MKGCIRRSAAFWVLLCALSVAAQQPTARFTVSVPEPATHVYHVVAQFSQLAGDAVEFKMPVWTPGYYGLFDYAKNVRGFAAADDSGHALKWEKSGANAWRVQTGGARAVNLAYDVLADNPFVAASFVDESHGYITPGALFLYIPGQLRRAATVTVEPCAKWSTVATGLDPVSNGTPHTFIAPDFDVLYDSPILMGNLEALPPFAVQGVPHYFYGYKLGDFDRQQLMTDLKSVVEAGTKIIGDIPYKHYTFLGIGPGMGGIEHLNSAAVSFTSYGKGRSRTGELSFLAHEYFHNYNVKRIRPIALGPFDYDKPNLTNMLWVSEGFTVYYEYLMLARSGKMTLDQLLHALSGDLAAYEKDTGHLFQSATASSRETWEQGPFGGAPKNGIKRTISYYQKGPILGMLLDFKIRHETANRQSLDDVMRELYRKYYKELGRGWTDEEFRQTCERVAGVPLNENFEYADTTRDIDYDKYLAYAGLKLEPPTELADAWLGAISEDDHGSLVVAAVEPGSAADKAGLRARDVIKALDGVTVNARSLQEAVAGRKPQERVQLTIAREGQEKQVEVVLGHKLQQSYRIRPIDNPNALQKQILQDWVRPTVL